MGGVGLIIYLLGAIGNRNTIEHSMVLHHASSSRHTEVPSHNQLLRGPTMNVSVFSILHFPFNSVREFHLLQGFCNEFTNPEEVYFENCNLRTIQKQFCENLHKITIS